MAPGKRKRVKPKPKKEILEEYRGYVISLEKDTFWAEIINKDDNTTYHVEVYLREVKPEERDRVFEGNRFTWLIYQYTPRVADIAYSEFQFDEIQYWTAEEIEQAEKKAEKLMKLFGWEKDNPINRDDGS